VISAAPGNNWSSILLTDFEAVIGRLPEYADGPNCGWVCHRTFYYTVMVRVELAAGGVTASEIREGARTPMFLGYPVRFSQVFPKVAALNQIPVIFGDLALGSSMGERRLITIDQSEHVFFTADAIALRGTERIDIVVHDVGNADAVAANREPGPIVALQTAAS
jgi:HK97 family phage major capsid protein